MARLITETFEGDHLFRFGNQLGLNGTSQVVSNSGAGIDMDGAYSLSMETFDGVLDMPLLNYSGNPTLGVIPGTTVTPTEIYFGFFFRANNPDNLNQPGVGGTIDELTHRIVSVWNGNQGICTLRIAAEGNVKLRLLDGAFYYTTSGFAYNGDLILDGSSLPVILGDSTGSQPISADTLYHIQMRVKLDGVNSIVQVKQDDTLVIDYTGPLCGGANPTTMSRIIWYSAGTSYAQNFGNQWIDDIVVNDTTTATCMTDATWPGILRFKVQNVTGPGTYAQFTPVGDTPNYNTIDDLPNDGDATYNYALSSNSGFKDSFPVSPNALDATQVTYRAWFEEVIARKNGGTSQIRLGVRRAGTDYYQASGQNVGVSYDVYDNRLCQDPSSLTAWTSAGLDATEIIYQII